MIRICTILLICGLFVGQAGADSDVDIAAHGTTTIIEEPTQSEIRAILERCREFVRDGKKDLLSTEEEYAIYYPTTLLSIAKGEAKEAQDKVDRIERETALRRDIEAMLKRLTNGSNGSLEKEG